MKILIINNSKKSDMEIESFLKEYFLYLEEICKVKPLYEIVFAENQLKNEVKKMNVESHNIFNTFVDYYIENACGDLKGELAKYIMKDEVDKTKTIILSEDSKTIYPWGEANDFVSVIRMITMSNLWHEFSHNFGVSDHYDENDNYRAISSCDLDSCIMRYGNSTYEICKFGTQELKVHLNKLINIF